MELHLSHIAGREVLISTKYHCQNASRYLYIEDRGESKEYIKRITVQ